MHTHTHTHMQLLAVGTSKGVLGVYNMSMGEDYICPVAVFTAHPPRDGQQDMRFGQLNSEPRSQAYPRFLYYRSGSQRDKTCNTKSGGKPGNKATKQ